MRDPKKLTPKRTHAQSGVSTNERFSLLTNYQGKNFTYYPNTHAFFSIERYYSNQKAIANFSDQYIDPVYAFNKANRRFIKQCSYAFLFVLIIFSFSNIVFTRSNFKGATMIKAPMNNITNTTTFILPATKDELDKTKSIEDKLPTVKTINEEPLLIEVLPIEESAVLAPAFVNTVYDKNITYPSHSFNAEAKLVNPIVTSTSFKSDRLFVKESLELAALTPIKNPKLFTTKLDAPSIKSGSTTTTRKSTKTLASKASLVKTRVNKLKPTTLEAIPNLSKPTATKRKLTAKKKVSKVVKKAKSTSSNTAVKNTEEQFQQLAVKAAVEGKLYFLKFEAKWCLPCKMMEETTFSEKNVKQYITENYLPLKVDIDDFDGYNLKKKYNITRLPSILIFNATGELVARYEESMGPSKMLDVLKEHNIAINKKKTLKNLVSNTATVELQLTKEEQLQQLLKLTKVRINDIQLYQENDKLVSKLKSNAKKRWVETTVNLSLDKIEKELITGASFRLDIKDLDNNKMLVHQDKDSKKTGIDFDYTTDQINLSYFNKDLKKAKNYELQIALVKDGKTYILANKQIVKNGKVSQ